LSIDTSECRADREPGDFKSLRVSPRPFVRRSPAVANSRNHSTIPTTLAAFGVTSVGSVSTTLAAFGVTSVGSVVGRICLTEVRYRLVVSVKWLNEVNYYVFQ
jgi:hypothetical protein